MLRVCLLVVTVLSTSQALQNAEGTLNLNKPGEGVNFDPSVFFWTEWMSAGTGRRGDFENVYLWLNSYCPKYFQPGACPLECSNPLAVRWRLASNRDDAEYVAAVEQCVVLDTDTMTGRGKLLGFNCHNFKQFYSTCEADQCKAAKMSDDTHVKRLNRNYACTHCPDFEVQYLCPINSVAREVVSDWRDEERLLDLELAAEEAERALDEFEEELERREVEKRTLLEDDSDSQLLKRIEQLLHSLDDE